MYRNRNLEMFQTKKKTAAKSEKVVNFVDNKNKYNTDSNKSHKNKVYPSNNKKTWPLKMIPYLKLRFVI